MTTLIFYWLDLLRFIPLWVLLAALAVVVVIGVVRKSGKLVLVKRAALAVCIWLFCMTNITDGPYILNHYPSFGEAVGTYFESFVRLNPASGYMDISDAEHYGFLAFLHVVAFFSVLGACLLELSLHENKGGRFTGRVFNGMVVATLLIKLLVAVGHVDGYWNFIGYLVMLAAAVCAWFIYKARVRRKPAAVV